MCDLVSALATAAAVSVGGSIVGGIQQRNTANANASMMRAEAAREGQLGALRDSAVRRDYRMKAGLQRSQLAAQGVTLDSLTSLDLGRDLGEQAFLDSQNARLDSASRQTRLTNESRLARAEGSAALFRGFSSAASTALTAAPTLWPGLQGAG